MTTSHVVIADLACCPPLYSVIVVVACQLQQQIMRRGIDGLQHLDRPPMKPLPTVPISFEEFLDWCDEDTRAEWVNGKVVLLSPESVLMHRLLSFLARSSASMSRNTTSAGLRVEFHDEDGRDPKWARARSAVHHARASGTASQAHLSRWRGDLAVEVVSPESVDRDEDEKFREYAKAGVREYWLINPMRQAADFFELKSTVDTSLSRSKTVWFDRESSTASSCALEWLWQTPSDARMSFANLA